MPTFAPASAYYPLMRRMSLIAVVFKDTYMTYYVKTNFKDFKRAEYLLYSPFLNSIPKSSEQMYKISVRKYEIDVGLCLLPSNEKDESYYSSVSRYTYVIPCQNHTSGLNVHILCIASKTN